MFVSLDIRRLIGLVAVSGAFAALVPVAQAGTGFNGAPDAVDRAGAARQAELGSGFSGSPDAIDRVVAARQAQLTADYDAREHAQLAVTPALDVVDRAVVARRLNSTSDLSGMPDVLERTAAAGTLQYQPASPTPSRFDWNDFGIGAGAGVGLMLLLGLGIGTLVVRHSNGGMKTA
jgi:hypothetical protein